MIFSSVPGCACQAGLGFSVADVAIFSAAADFALCHVALRRDVAANAKLSDEQRLVFRLTPDAPLAPMRVIELFTAA